MFQGYTHFMLSPESGRAVEHQSPEQQQEDPHRTPAQSPVRHYRFVFLSNLNGVRPYTQANNGRPSQRVRTTNGMAVMISPLTDKPWWSHAPRHTTDSHHPI